MAELGEERYSQILEAYLKRHQWGNTKLEDFSRVVLEHTLKPVESDINHDHGKSYGRTISGSVKKTLSDLVYEPGLEASKYQTREKFDFEVWRKDWIEKAEKEAHAKGSAGCPK